MSLARSIAYGAMLGSIRRDARAFGADKGGLERCQRERLAKMLARNADTAFGRAHGFDGIRSFEDYQNALPMTDYDGLMPWIDQIAAGETNVLTSDPVARFVPSSGSVAAMKFIPYTESLRKEMHRGIAPWVRSTYAARPELKRGRAYCSISPPTAVQDVRGAIPVGFADDEEYLGRLGRWAYRQLFITPGKVEAGEFHQAHAVSLLAAEDMRLLSVWSPTYLLSLFEQMRIDAEAILGRLAEVVSHKRLSLLSSCLSEGDFVSIWPALQLVSCWTDGPSEAPARWLAEALPHATVQPKGLMATEAVISVPIADGVDPVLAYRSHVFEFIDATRRATPPWAVAVGQRYGVVVTTGGGLWRYPLGDEIEVTGFYHSLPTMRFVGKTSMVSDRCGEKLNAAFVAGCLGTLKAEGLLDDGFAMLAPSVGEDRSVRYMLFYCPAHQGNESKQDTFEGRLEALLSGNYHYRNCRQLKQLQHVVARSIPCEPPDAMRMYQERVLLSGVPAGQIKFSPLSGLEGWQDTFLGPVRS